MILKKWIFALFAVASLSRSAALLFSFCGLLPISAVSQLNLMIAPQPTVFFHSAFYRPIYVCLKDGGEKPNCDRMENLAKARRGPFILEGRPMYSAAELILIYTQTDLAKRAVPKLRGALCHGAVSGFYIAKQPVESNTAPESEGTHYFSCL